MIQWSWRLYFAYCIETYAVCAHPVAGDATGLLTTGQSKDNAVHDAQPCQEQWPAV
ncbi:hypothetical protein IG631_05587 [Alternaria alternata]|nr:hypothetical protein IG631_05587 [Alternaria alternata]